MSIRWGVIGAGGIARRRTIPEGILSASNSVLSCVMDKDVQIAEEVGKEFAVPYFTELDPLLALRDIDAVYIATPTYLHCEQTIRAAEAGKHVLCEKPMAMTLDECDRMIDACRGNGVKLGFGYMMRFHAWHAKAKELIDAGKLGSPVFGRAQLTCWYPPIDGAWRQDLKLGGGGVMVDLATHCIDLLEYFFGRVQRVSAMIDTLTHSYAVDDSATVLLKFANGCHGLVDTFFNVPDEGARNVLEIFGTKGVVTASGTIGQNSSGKMSLYKQESEICYDAGQKRSYAAGWEEIDLEPINIYRAEIESFASCILNDKHPMVGGEEARHNLNIVLKAYESARLGKTVDID